MNNVPVMSDGYFRAIQAWFANTDAAQHINNLEAIVVTEDFPNAVNFICNNKPRYFLVSESLVRDVARSTF